MGFHNDTLSILGPQSCIHGLVLNIVAIDKLQILFASLGAAIQSRHIRSSSDADPTQVQPSLVVACSQILVLALATCNVHPATSFI